MREGDKPLPAATVEYYLRNSPVFICDTKKVYFRKFDAKNGYPELDEKGNKKFTYTSAFVFYLDKLNLSIADEHLNGESWNGKELKDGRVSGQKAETLSFCTWNQVLPCKTGYFSYLNYFKNRLKTIRVL